MRCDLCDRSTYIYTGLKNPWQECRSCGTLYCDRCSRGERSYSTEVDDSTLYQVYRAHVCPRCSGQLQRKAG